MHYAKKKKTLKGAKVPVTPTTQVYHQLAGN